MVSYWEQTTFFAEQDIIIIGGGFVGLWTALELIQKNPKTKITIVDSGIIPTGASTKNAGFCCFGSPTELINDAKNNNETELWNLVYKRYHGLRKIHYTFSYKAIDYSNCGGYECLLQKDVAMVEEKLSWLNTGMKLITDQNNTFSFSKSKLQSFGLTNFDALIENNLEGSLNPAKLVQQLQLKLQELGVQLLQGVAIEQYETSSKIKLYTNKNFTLTCNRLLICTNAFATKLIPNSKIKPQRGQVCITSPIHDLKLKGTFHFDEGYYYFRNVNDRILIGGARNKDFENEQTSELDITENIQTALKDFIKKHLLLNHEFTIAQQWSGIMGFSQNKLPVIQQIEPNVYCAVGMSGMGVALAPFIATDTALLMQ
jgi:gamma-glutamylputrescine oxidase